MSHLKVGQKVTKHVEHKAEVKKAEQKKQEPPPSAAPPSATGDVVVKKAAHEETPVVATGQKATTPASMQVKSAQEDVEASYGRIDAAFKAGTPDAIIAALRGLDGLHPQAQVSRDFQLGSLLVHHGASKEGMGLVASTLPLLSKAGQAQAALLLAQGARDLREFASSSKYAARGLETLRAAGLPPEKAKLLASQLHFAAAVAHKNLGNMSEAVSDMEAAVHFNATTSNKLALAGYIALAGDATQGKALFDEIPVPTSSSKVNEQIDYAMNAAWFHALANDLDSVVKHGKHALALAKQHPEFLGIAKYFHVETDFDRFRSDPKFQVLIN